MRAKLVLLDANVIIEAFRLEIWDDLIEKVEVNIVRSIYEDEQHTILKQLRVVGNILTWSRILQIIK